MFSVSDDSFSFFARSQKQIIFSFVCKSQKKLKESVPSSWLAPLILESSTPTVKNEAPYAASCSFLIEVSDSSLPHTCVKQMIMLLESFTVTLLRWIWAAISHHANVAAQKRRSRSPPSLGRTIFASLQRKITRYLSIQLFICKCKLPLCYQHDCYLLWVQHYI